MGTSNRCLTMREERLLRQAMARRKDAARDFAVFRALLTTGMRISEFLSLTVPEVKAALAIERLLVPASRRKGEACDLFVYLRGEAREAFADLLKLAGDDGPLVPGRDGRPLTPRAYQLRLKRWAHESGVDDRLSPHWLRHTFGAQFCRMSTASPTETCIRLANLLGHADPRTCSHYLTMSRDDDPGAAIETAFRCRKRITKAQARRAFELRAA
ncbi:MAG: tyrosine-type recombinase/integrase [Dechloromonas sp.]|nr:tyrosine-type recombinase/integrase [Dechloromonas sp.]